MSSDVWSDDHTSTPDLDYQLWSIPSDDWAESYPPCPDCASWQVALIVEAGEITVEETHDRGCPALARTRAEFAAEPGA